MEYVAHQMMFRLQTFLYHLMDPFIKIHLTLTQTDSEPVPHLLSCSSGSNALFLCKLALRITQDQWGPSCLTWNNLKPVLSLIWSPHSWAGHMKSWVLLPISLALSLLPSQKSCPAHKSCHSTCKTCLNLELLRFSLHCSLCLEFPFPLNQPG